MQIYTNKLFEKRFKQIEKSTCVENLSKKEMDFDKKKAITTTTKNELNVH